MLIDEYESPIYAGPRNLQRETEWIEVFNGSHLRLIRRVPGASPDVSEGIWQPQRSFPAGSLPARQPVVTRQSSGTKDLPGGTAAQTRPTSNELADEL